MRAQVLHDGKSISPPENLASVELAAFRCVGMGADVVSRLVTGWKVDIKPRPSASKGGLVFEFAVGIVTIESLAVVGCVSSTESEMLALV